jgi:pilus assembly protein FimV
MPTKMHSKKRSISLPFGLKTLSGAVLSALLVANANAAGLGKLTVHSALGQPLHAEIELTSVSPDEIGTLSPKLASPEAFRQANIDFHPALLSLRFAIEQRGGKQLIRVTSSQPMNEPFVDMLLELGGSGNRLVREYTFLLDPVDLRNSQSPSVAPIVLPPAPLARRGQPEQQAPAEPAAQTREVQSTNAAAVEKLPPAATGSKRSAAPLPPSPAGAEAGTDSYTVKNGDTLARIAGLVKPDGVSLDQMLVALYRTNPNAFAGNNMNRLRSGQILSVPDADTARNVGSGEARGVIVAQAADFNEYRNKLAGRVAQTAPQKSEESKQSAAGKITAKVEEQTGPSNESKDKLKLSKAGAAADKGGKPGLSTEERVAHEKALAEANSRAKDLEKNVAELQKLLELKNKELAERQKQLDASKVAAAKQEAQKIEAAAAKPAEQKPAVQDIKKPEPQPALKAETKVAEKPAATEVKPAPAPVKPAPEKAKPKVVVPPPEPEASLLDEPLVLWGGVGIIATLLGGALYYTRRKRQDRHFQDSIITDSSLKANSLFGSTGGQSVDTNNSVFNSSFAPSANQLDTNEVDPVAEADVYIAYGRDAQAEEILKEALRTQPERNAVRLKLLEIYSNRKDKRSFETLASELYSMTKGQGDDWMHAAALGAAIDPDNPLYAAAKGSPTTIGKAAGVESTQPLDEPDLDALLDLAPPPEPLKQAEPEPMNFESEVPSFELPEEAPVPEPLVEEKKEVSNDLDFDLDGIVSNSVQAPETLPRPPAPEEPKLDLGDINFDFLDSTNKPAEETPVAPAAPEQKAEMPALDIPMLEDLPMGGADDLAVLDAPAEVEAAAEPKADAAPAFDLSDIALELTPAEGSSGLVQEAYAVHDTAEEDYSDSAEMSTKLDLAVAYQEIGDKEGARELLEEVVKGGSPEQSEKAKGLLAKLA